MVFKASVRIRDLILQRMQKREEFVVPGLTEASGRRYPLDGDSRPIRKHCAMDKGCSQQPYCISTVPGGHTGSEAGMTGFLGLLNCFDDQILVINFATFTFKNGDQIYPGQ